MAKIKVKLIGSGKEYDPFKINLPTYIVYAEYNKITGEFTDSVNYEKKECYVLIPVDETTNGKIDQNKIRSKYKNWKDFNAADVEA